MAPDEPRSLIDDRTCALQAFTYEPVHAVAGIGDPERFFDMLRQSGLEVIAHPMPDHHVFKAADICFADDRHVLMTSKDAIKCVDIADHRHWQVPVAAVLSSDCQARVDALLDRLCRDAAPRV